MSTRDFSLTMVFDAPRVLPALALGAIADRLGLRDYQREAVQAAIAGLGETLQVQVIDAPTGAGKTRVASALIDFLIGAGYDVLLVAKRWELLEQAADDLCGLLPEHSLLLRRIGGGQSCMRRLADDDGGRLYLSTLQTWHRRQQKLPLRARPSRKLVVIYDEVHWGIFSRLGRCLRKRYRGRSPIFGLTATPLLGHGVQVIHATPADQLWGTVLASPKIREIPTGVCWTPTLIDNEYAPASLRELAEDQDRNLKVIGYRPRGIPEC